LPTGRDGPSAQQRPRGLSFVFANFTVVEA
jgi:hypothetical protein